MVEMWRRGTPAGIVHAYILAVAAKELGVPLVQNLQRQPRRWRLADARSSSGTGTWGRRCVAWHALSAWERVRFAWAMLSGIQRAKRRKAENDRGAEGRMRSPRRSSSWARTF